MLNIPTPKLPTPINIDLHPYRKRKERYYTTPYWPCVIKRCRMRYLYYSSRQVTEYTEKVYSYNPTAVLKPVKWSLIVPFKRKRLPVPEEYRKILCVYVDTRHIGHVEYLGEEILTFGELKMRKDLLDKISASNEHQLKLLVHYYVIGWRGGQRVTDNTQVKVVLFRWIDFAIGLAIGHFKKTDIREFMYF